MFKKHGRRVGPSQQCQLPLKQITVLMVVKRTLIGSSLEFNWFFLS